MTRSPLPPITWLATVVLALAAAGAAWLRAGFPLPGCPLREWAGVPCATCGTGRMLAALVAGDVSAAAGFNPFVLVVLASALLWVLAAVALRGSGRPWRPIGLGRRGQRVLALAAAVLFVLSWAWQIWRHH
jgi:hypothetical protein